jgi:hypothetical protein
MFSTVFLKQTFIMVFWLCKSDVRAKVSRKAKGRGVFLGDLKYSSPFIF